MQLKFTSQQIDSAKSLGLAALGNYSYKTVLEYLYSIDICIDNEIKMYQISIALQILYKWQQSQNGNINPTTMVNYSSLEDINKVISWINRECR